MRKSKQKSKQKKPRPPGMGGARSSAFGAADLARLKKQFAEIIGRHRSMAFNTCLDLHAKENPKGLTHAFLRWFHEAWIASLKAGSP